MNNVTRPKTHCQTCVTAQEPEAPISDTGALAEFQGCPEVQVQVVGN
jgi:hypothetical protein